MNTKYCSLMLVTVLSLFSANSHASSPAGLNDLEIAHVAYAADVIDIRSAHPALALSTNPDIHDFANTMIRDHEAVNEQALALLNKLGAEAQDNLLSRKISADAEGIIAELASLRGSEFDKRYAENELAYHKAVNGLVADSFIPNIENEEVKSLFQAGLKFFKAHENHASMMIKKLE